MYNLNISSLGLKREFSHLSACHIRLWLWVRSPNPYKKPSMIGCPWNPSTWKETTGGSIGLANQPVGPNWQAPYSSKRSCLKTQGGGLPRNRTQSWFLHPEQCVQACKCVYAHTHTYIHIYTYTHIYTYIHIYTHTYIYICHSKSVSWRAHWVTPLTVCLKQASKVSTEPGSSSRPTRLSVCGGDAETGCYRDAQ